MIWQSLFFMTLLDVAIITMAMGVIFIFYPSRAKLKTLRLHSPLAVIIIGQTIIGIYYIFDLFSMHILPMIVGSATAMQFMLYQHLNASWIVSLLAIALISGSLSFVIIKLVPRILTAESEIKSELREKEILLQTIFDTIPIGIQVRDRNDKKLFVNKARAARVGMSAEEFLQSPEDYPKYFEKDAIAEIENINREVMENGVTREMVRLRSFRDMPEQWIHSIRVPLKDGEGKITGLIDLSEDITERKRAEEELHASQRLLQTVFDTIPHTLIVKDKESRYVKVNKAWCDFYGLSPEDVLGKTALEIPGKPEEEKVNVLNEDQRALEGEDAALMVEHTRIDKSGSRRHMENIRSQILDDKGDVVGLVAIALDITQRKHAEEELQRKEKILRTVVVNSPVILWAIDQDGLITLSEGKGLQSQGRKPGELVGTSIFDAYKKFPDFLADVVRALGGEAFNAVHKMNGAVCERWFEPLTDPGGKPAGLLGVSLDITERWEAEEKLRTNEALLQAIFDAIPTMVFVKDKNSRILKANKAFEENYGAMGESVPTMDLPYATPAEKKKFVASDRAVMKTGKPLELPEVPVTVKDGTTRVFQSIKVPLRDAGGEIIGLVANSIDITESKRVEEELRASQKLLQTVFDTIPEFLYVKDRNCRFIMVNQRVANYFGVPAEQILHQPPEALPWTNEEAKQATLEHDRQVMETDRPHERPEVLTVVGGKEAIMRIIKLPLHDDFGHVIGVVGISEDITESKQVEKTLRENQRLLQTVFDTIPHAIFVKDLEDRYIKVNSAFSQRFVNLASKDIEGRTLAQLGVGTEEEVQVHRALDREVIKTGERVESIETFTFHDDEKRSLKLSQIPLRGEDGSVVGVVGIGEDITESRKIEEQLRQAQKMDSVGQLAGGVAHDFNNMLQIISGYTELALSREGISDKITKDLQKVRKGSESAADLTRQLLLFSRQNVLTLRNLDINDLIKNLMNLMDRLLGAELELQVITGDGLGPVHGDPGMIEQVLMNLCVNARDAMPEGGRLVIETRKIEVDEAQSGAEGWEAPGGYVLITVADNGTGIAKEALPNIFDPFFSTKEAGKGTGLGLSVVHGIVKQHGGRITVYSELGQGTTFNVFLPVAEKAEAGLAEQKALPVIGGTETILVADDEADILQLTTELLENEGYTVLGASDGEEAVRIFNDHSGEIALALLDLSMPKMSGRGVYGEISPLNPKLPFIFNSGYSASIMDKEFLDSTNSILIQKPFTPSTLLHTVREALDRASTEKLKLKVK